MIFIGRTGMGNSLPVHGCTGNHLCKIQSVC